MGYLVAWMEDIDPDNHEGSTIDRYEVFTDDSLVENAKKAHDRYNELIRTDNVTSVSVCRIETSTEPHYVNWN